MLALAFAIPARAGEPAAIRRVPIADAALAATEQSRMNLKYLASCALDPGTILVGEVDGRTYEWPGGMGLAPDWHRRALTEAEERWVSACIFARTNRFGVRVLLSLRSPFPTDAPGLQVSPDELHEFPVEEATFFGNVFRGPGIGYVCGATDDIERQRQLARHRRVCAVPLDEPSATGSRATVCDFVHVGVCTPEAFAKDGVSYREAVVAYLPAEPRGDDLKPSPQARTAPLHSDHHD